MKRIYIVLVVIVLLVVLMPDLYGQCSQCKLLAEHNAQDDEILGKNGNRINTGILYIMVIPYLILAFLFRKQIARLFKKKESAV